MCENNTALKIKCSVISIFICFMYLVSSVGDSQQDHARKRALVNNWQIFGARVPPTGLFLNIPLSK